MKQVLQRISQLRLQTLTVLCAMAYFSENISISQSYKVVKELLIYEDTSIEDKVFRKELGHLEGHGLVTRDMNRNIVRLHSLHGDQILKILQDYDLFKSFWCKLSYPLYSKCSEANVVTEVDEYVSMASSFWDHTENQIDNSVNHLYIQIFLDDKSSLVYSKLRYLGLKEISEKSAGQSKPENDAELSKKNILTIVLPLHLQCPLQLHGLH